MVDAAGPVALRALVRPNPRQYLSRSAAVRAPRGGDISVEVDVRSGDPFAQAHDRDVLASAIAALPAEHRIVVALRYYRDLTVEDIASRLGIPAGTVHSRLHYALKRLHASIDAADAKGAVR